jgi:hypothetical protein
MGDKRPPPRGTIMKKGSGKLIIEEEE